MAKKKKLAGFREARQKRYRAAGKKRGSAKPPAKAASAPEVTVRSEAVSLKLGPGGRFVIPKKLRKAMNVQAGDVMTAEVVDGELRVRSWETAIRKVQAMFAPYKRPGVSEVDELLDDRRREFELEERKYEEDRRRAARLARMKK